MKPLERQFFKFCIKQIDYNSTSSNIKFKEGISFKSLIEEFSEKKKCSKKQLYYYLDKWESTGIIKYVKPQYAFCCSVFYDFTIDFAWFDLDNLCKNINYFSIIPIRVICKAKVFGNDESKIKISYYGGLSIIANSYRELYFIIKGDASVDGTKIKR